MHREVSLNVDNQLNSEVKPEVNVMKVICPQSPTVDSNLQTQLQTSVRLILLLLFLLSELVSVFAAARGGFLAPSRRTEQRSEGQRFSQTNTPTLLTSVRDCC